MGQYGRRELLLHLTLSAEEPLLSQLRGRSVGTNPNRKSTLAGDAARACMASVSVRHSLELPPTDGARRGKLELEGKGQLVTRQTLD